MRFRESSSESLCRWAATCSGVRSFRAVAGACAAACCSSIDLLSQPRATNVDYTQWAITLREKLFGVPASLSTRIAIIILCLEANLVYCSRIGLRFGWIGFAQGAVVMRLGDANFVTAIPVSEQRSAFKAFRSRMLQDTHKGES